MTRDLMGALVLTVLELWAWRAYRNAGRVLDEAVDG